MRCVSCFERFPMLKCFLYTFFTFLRRKKKKQTLKFPWKFYGYLLLCISILGACKSLWGWLCFVSHTFPFVPQPLGHAYYCKFWFCGVICSAFFLIWQLFLMNPGRTQVGTNELNRDIIISILWDHCPAMEWLNSLQFKPFFFFFLYNKMLDFTECHKKKKSIFFWLEELNTYIAYFYRVCSVLLFPLT